MSDPGGVADRNVCEPGRRGLYRRLFAWMVARFEIDDERTVALKERLLGDLRGTVAEIGAGAGANLRYLPRETRYVAVEPNIHMHAHLRAEAQERERPVEIRTGVGERLPFEDRSLDAVISTLVLCSVDDVDSVLAEVRRVLRPGGRFVFLEHVGAPRGSSLRRWQERIRPLWRRIGDGCEPDRDLEDAVRRAGFASVEVERYAAEVPIALVRPHIAGVAVAGSGDERAAGSPSRSRGPGPVTAPGAAGIRCREPA